MQMSRIETKLDDISSRLNHLEDLIEKKLPSGEDSVFSRSHIAVSSTASGFRSRDSTKHLLRTGVEAQNNTRYVF